jgi:hypothetical protein
LIDQEILGCRVWRSLGQAWESYTNNPSLQTTGSRRDKWCSKDSPKACGTHWDTDTAERCSSVTSAASAYWLSSVEGCSRTIEVEPYHAFGERRTASCSGLCLPYMAKPMLTGLTLVLFWPCDKLWRTERVSVTD